MFMDFKFFDEMVAKLEEQRKVAFQAWEDWLDAVEKLAKAK